MVMQACTGWHAHRDASEKRCMQLGALLFLALGKKRESRRRGCRQGPTLLLGDILLADQAKTIGLVQIRGFAKHFTRPTLLLRPESTESSGTNFSSENVQESALKSEACRLHRSSIKQ